MSAGGIVNDPLHTLNIDDPRDDAMAHTWSAFDREDLSAADQGALFIESRRALRAIRALPEPTA